MKKGLRWIIIPALIAGIVIGAFFWSSRPQTVGLNDGAKLTLLGVDYGRRHKCPEVSATAGGISNGGGPISFDTPDDTLVAWLKLEHKPGTQPPIYQALALVYDRAGTGCVGAYPGNYRQISPGMDIACIQLDAFPRRGRTFYLRFMEQSPRGPQMAAKGQFVIANPVRGPFPKWTPEPLPDTQSSGDLDVTLTRLVYGAHSFGNYNLGSVEKTRYDPLNKKVLAAFRTMQNGAVVWNWRPVRIETSDATGNQAYNNGSNYTRGNDEATVTYQWGLWPDEPAWKLRVEMARTSGFGGDELWTVQNIPVQPGSQQDFWNQGRSQTAAFAETTLNGIHLKLFPVIQFAGQSRGGQISGGFLVQADPEPEGMRMTLMTVTDDQGRDIENRSLGSGSGNQMFWLQNLGNARVLNITLAVDKSRFVEFTVKPVKW